MGAINVLGTLVAGALVDRAGRKQLLIVSFLGQAAAMLCMSAGLALPQLAVRHPLNFAANKRSILHVAGCCVFSRCAWSRAHCSVCSTHWSPWCISCLQAMSGTIALVGTLSYVLAFAIGVGPVPGILVSEINAAAIRGMHCTLGNYNRRHSPPFVIMLLSMPSCT